jgi:hypothetical protein
MVLYTYEYVKKLLEAEKCQLLTTEDEFNQMREEHKKIADRNKRRIVVKILSSCGHVTEKCFLMYFTFHGTGILCTDCAKLKANEKAKTNLEENGIKFLEQEYGIFLILKEELSKEFEVKKTSDGCKSDFYLRPKDTAEDEWLPVQLKTSAACIDKLGYSFAVHRDYSGMPVILFSLANKIWLVDGSDIRGVNRLSIGKTKSKYSDYEITMEELNDKIMEAYNDPKYDKKQEEEINMECTEKMKLEQEFRKYRENKIPFIEFIGNEMEGLAYDFMIGNKKVQEKVAGACKRNDKIYAIKAKISRHGDNGSNTPYSEGENDIYWIHMPDKKYFYVIPEAILIENGYISTKDQSGKSIITVTVNGKTEWLNKYLFNYENICIDNEKIRLIKSLGYKDLNELNKYTVLAKKEKENNKTKKIIFTKKEIALRENKRDNIINEKMAKMEANKNKCLDCAKEIGKDAERCQLCSSKYMLLESIKKTNRPSYLTLKKDLETMPCTKVGEKYGVSDKCISKWLRKYEAHNLTDS